MCGLWNDFVARAVTSATSKLALFCIREPEQFMRHFIIEEYEIVGDFHVDFYFEIVCTTLLHVLVHIHS